MRLQSYGPGLMVVEARYNVDWSYWITLAAWVVARVPEEYMYYEEP